MLKPTCGAGESQRDDRCSSSWMLQHNETGTQYSANRNHFIYMRLKNKRRQCPLAPNTNVHSYTIHSTNLKRCHIPLFRLHTLKDVEGNAKTACFYGNQRKRSTLQIKTLFYFNRFVAVFIYSITTHSSSHEKTFTSERCGKWLTLANRWSTATHCTCCLCFTAAQYSWTFMQAALGWPEGVSRLNFIWTATVHLFIHHLWLYKCLRYAEDWLRNTPPTPPIVFHLFIYLAFPSSLNTPSESV